MVFMMLSDFFFEVFIPIWNKFFLSDLKQNVGFQSWHSQNVCRIANMEDPDQTASSEAV